jgi:hypothetical protein
MDQIQLRQERVLWPTLVNTIMNHQVPQKAGNNWIAKRLLASQM